MVQRSVLRDLNNIMSGLLNSSFTFKFIFFLNAITGAAEVRSSQCLNQVQKELGGIQDRRRSSLSMLLWVTK